MENSNRNHRVLAGVLTAAMVLSSFSMGTAGAFAENGPVAEKSGIELRQAGEPVITVTKANNADTTVANADVITAIKKAKNIADGTTVALYSKTTSEGTWTLETGAVSVSDAFHFYAYTTKVGEETESAQTAITIKLNNTATAPTGEALNFTSKSTGTVDELKQAIKNTVSTANTADTTYTGALSSATITLKDITGSEVTDNAQRNTVVSYVVSGVAGYDNLTVSGVTVKVTKAYVLTDATSFELPHDGTQASLKTAIASKVNTVNTLKDATAVTADNITLETGTNTAAAADTAVTDIKAYKVAAKGDFEETEATDVTVKVTAEKKDYVLTDDSVKKFELTEAETLADLKSKIVDAVKAKNAGATFTTNDVTLTTASGDATESTKPIDVTGYKIAAVGTYNAVTATGVAVTVKAKAEATATTTTLAITDKDSKVATGSAYGDALTLTAAVKKGDTDAAAADGTVQFYEGETKLGDAVAIADGKATATVSTLAAGAHSITAKFVPADATKVKESASTATAVTVAKKALTAVVTADNEKTYDGKATATVKLTLTGVVDKDDVTATAAATLEDANAGDKKAIKSITGAALAGTTAGNYTLADTAVATQTGAEGAKTDITVKVNKASFTVKPVAPVLIKTGEKTAQTLVTDLSKVASGIVGETGVIKYEAASTVDTANVATNVLTLTPKDTEKGFATGNQTVTVTVSNSNYNDATITVSVTVTDKKIISGATATLEKASQIYNGAEQLPKLTEVKYDTDTTLDLTAKTTTVTAKYIKDDKEVTTVKDAGTYKVVYTITTADSMTVVEASYTITPAELTEFTVAPATMVEGDTKFPEFSVKTNVVGTDKADTAANYVYNVTDKDGKNVAAKDVKASCDYTIQVVATTIANSNYTVKAGATFTPAKLTVSAKPSGPSYPSGPSTPSEPTVAPVQVTATAASSNATVKAALDKIVAGKDDKSVVATFKKTDKKIAISATTLAGQSVYIYKLVGNTLAVVDNKAEAVGKDGTLTMDNPEAAVTKKLARTADDSTVTYVLIPATEKPPVASVSGTVEVAQGNVVLFDVTSGKSTDAGFAAGNDAVSETRLYTAYKDGKASYGAYGHGKEGQTTGIYVNGVKLFDVKVVKAPYKSDTTVNITNKKHGAMYWFEITPDNASATVSYTAGNGAVLSTRSKGKQKNGSYLFGLQITGKTGDKSGVYVQINGQNYCVFNVTVA